VDGMEGNLHRQISVGVIKEIQRAIGSTVLEKKKAAATARSYLTTYDGAYSIIDNISDVPLRQAFIGVDSKPDREVISLAINASKKNPEDLVMVMTHDTGIHLELSRWKNGCPNLYYLSSEKIIEYKKALADKLQFHYQKYGPYYVVKENLPTNSVMVMVLDSNTFTEHVLYGDHSQTITQKRFEPLYKSKE